MEEQVYLIKTTEEEEKLWKRLRTEHWESAILCLHEDLWNLDVRKKILPGLYQYKIQDIELHWVEPATMYLRVMTSIGGELQLEYYLRPEKIIFEENRHTIRMSYIEEAQASGLGGLLGGFAKSASGKTYLQMAVQNMPMIRADGQRVEICLDAWSDFQKVCRWTYEDKTLGKDLELESLGMLNRCFCVRARWR